MFNFSLNRRAIILALTVVIILGIASVIPIIQTYGKLNIGNGDTFIPPIPENSFKMAYEWLDRNNGEYISNDYRVWLSILALLKANTFTIYQAAFLYQFLIFFLSGTGLYKIFNLYNKGHPLWGLIPAIFFIFSPHLFDHMIYYQGTVAIVWLTYVFLKSIRFKKFTLVDIIAIGILVSVIVDLPNPKYHFLIFLLYIVGYFFALVLKLININLKKICIYSMSIFLITAFISLPFLFFGYIFSNDAGPHINVKINYQETGVALDYGVATVNKMITLFHTPNLLAFDYGVIHTPPFQLIYYSIALIVLCLFPFVISKLKGEEKKFYLLLYLLALFFIFLSKGTNPPYGFIYDYLISHYKIFAFLRTTAGIVIYASVFYALIYGQFTKYVSSMGFFPKKWIIFVSFVLILVAGYPIWTGSFFLNHPLNVEVDRKSHGLIIPPDYFKAADFLKKINLDTKVDIYPGAQGYEANSWGYFGFIIYPWIIDKPMVAFDKSTILGKINSNTNALYIFHDKSLQDDYPEKNFWNTPDKLIFHSKVIDIFQKKIDQFIPHFYIPEEVIIKKSIDTGLLKQVDQKRLAIYPNNSAKLPTLIENNATVEYRKINPTKYVIKIHKARSVFPLIFTENYHSQWKLYAVNRLDNQVSYTRETDSFINQFYKVTKENIDVQSSVEELKQYTKEGKVSLNPLNKSPIRFVSKEFKKTIQNDNISSGTIFDTWSTKPIISDANHISVNGYANSWIIDSNSMCKNLDALCQENNDGSFDIEFIAEFWPQRLSYLGYIISSSTVIIFLITILLRFLYKKITKH